MILGASALGKVGFAGISLQKIFGVRLVFSLSRYKKLIYNIGMSRTIKQVIYGAIYLGVFLGVITWIYFLYLKPAPTCFDNMENQGEEGIDCGGPCAKVCTPVSIQPIEVVSGSVMTFATSLNHVTFLARITNVNSDFAARSFDYHFDLYDATGVVIQSLSGQSFIYAGEAKYLILPNEEVTSSVSNVAFMVLNPIWAKSSDLGTAPRFVFQNMETGTVSLNMVGVSGTITNGDASAFDEVTVIAIFKNTAGVPVGASQTELGEVAANGAYDFRVTYPATRDINLAATEIAAYGLRP